MARVGCLWEQDDVQVSVCVTHPHPLLRGEQGYWVREKQEKKALRLLHVITRVNFLPTSPCFVSIRSMDDLSHIKYSTHPVVKGLLKTCIM